MRRVVFAATISCILLASCTPATVSSFPAEYQARWRESDATDGCSAGSVHGAITIAAKSVTDGEFSSKVQRFQVASPRSLIVDELFNDFEEGPQRYTSTYILSDDGQRLTVRMTSQNNQKIESEPAEYIKCGSRNG